MKGLCVPAWGVCLIAEGDGWIVRVCGECGVVVPWWFFVLWSVRNGLQAVVGRLSTLMVLHCFSPRRYTPQDVKAAQEASQMKHCKPSLDLSGLKPAISLTTIATMAHAHRHLTLSTPYPPHPLPSPLPTHPSIQPRTPPPPHPYQKTEKNSLKALLYPNSRCTYRIPLSHRQGPGTLFRCLARLPDCRLPMLVGFRMRMGCREMQMCVWLRLGCGSWVSLGFGSVSVIYAGEALDRDSVYAVGL